MFNKKNIYIAILLISSSCALYLFHANHLIGGIGALLTSYVVKPWNPWPFVDFNVFCYNIYAHLFKSHTATADERILPNGTAYISDLGMTGALNSMLGTKKGPIMKHFLM